MTFQESSVHLPTFPLNLPLLRFTVLFSHGNAVDLGQMSSFYIGLGSRIGCNIFSYDYSGYGVSTGKPTEKNLYADIDAAWHALRTRYVVLETSQTHRTVFYLSYVLTRGYGVLTLSPVRIYIFILQL